MAKLLAFITTVLFVAGIAQPCQPPALAAAPQQAAVETLPLLPESSAADKAHWLAYGALYEVLNHNRVKGYDQLECKLCRDNAPNRSISLSQAWGIYSRDSALERLDRFFAPGRYPGYEQIYHEYLRDKAAADRELLNQIDIAQISLAKHLRYGDADFDRVKTVSAWDFMRCANLVKVCYNIGYITEEEAWIYLRENAAMADAVFDSWQDYFISFMLGRVISYATTGTDEYVLAAKRLFEDRDCEWDYAFYP